MRSPDAKSGAGFERLVIDGRPQFLKVLSWAEDWIMRVTGNTTYWEFQCWRAGLYAACPSQINHTVVGKSLEGTGPGASARAQPARDGGGARLGGGGR